MDENSSGATADATNAIAADPPIKEGSVKAFPVIGNTNILELYDSPPGAA